jgi:RHS repeat-associated protein
MYKNILRVLGAVAIIILGTFMVAQAQSGIWNPDYSIGTSTGVTNFSYTQTPAQLVVIYPAAIPATGVTYQWYSSTMPTMGFAPISGATASSYSLPALTATSVPTYYYLLASYTSTPALTLNGVATTSITSNVLKINVVSVNWEDINYVREHDVLSIAQSTWTGVDQLPIGSKLQTTTYLDGLGRTIQKVAKQTATPAAGSTTWGDQVQFSVYDQYSRQPVKYLPYTTTNQPGVFKTTEMTDQPAYYANPATYNQTSAFTTLTFDNSPLNRVVNVKESGAAWAASAGSSANYDMNTAADSVQIWATDYVQGDAPVNLGQYAVNTLAKFTTTDVNGNQTIEFKNTYGLVILRKVQATSGQAAGYGGWICTYFVYDDFGQLRFEIQPMGVQYLDANGWSFAGTNGATVLTEQVFLYNYDSKGRTIWKKTPGAAASNIIYDIRDRIVFTQDGNQAALPTPQWTVSLYDPLDRPVATALFNTTETVANLQSDLAGATATSSVSVTAAPNTGGITVPLTLSLCPVSLNSTSLNSSTSTEVLKYLFYDNYTFPVVTTFNTSYTNLSAYSTSDPNVSPITPSQRAWNLPTGRMLRVLGSTSTFLATTNYYDEKARIIQSSVGNIRNGKDIRTLQYRWDGRALSSCRSHTNSTGGYSAYITLTKYVFDNLGRIDSIEKQYGSNAMKTVSSYQYDDMGRLATKNLDPAYANVNSGSSGLESLKYSYNIHNQIMGINQDYAMKNPADYNKWGHFFGEYLGYDLSINTFAAAQLDGQLTGKVWSTQGDDVQRRYDYTYDNANRLVNAQYEETQTANSGWNHTQMDFKMIGHRGTATYDLNGNLLTMLHEGVIPGLTAPIAIDDLSYSYNAFSNKLSSVTDLMTNTAYNGLSGDFKDGKNGSAPDYVFDNNGNEVIDLNKNIQSLNNGAAGTNGSHYNYLDKPDQIRVAGQGTIEIIYDADGEMLQRTFIPDTAGQLATVTSYIDDFVYQARGLLTLSAAIPYTAGSADTLDYINFEEGRVRVVTPFYGSNGYDVVSEAGNLTLPQTTLSGVWDYFIKDYQSNIRMVLTEESHQGVNRCTMETDRAAAEDPVFGQSGTSNQVETTRVPVPSGWTNNTSASCSELGNLFGQNLGPNTLQKVMAGDLINTSVLYYYPSQTTTTNPNVVKDILGSLLSMMGGPATAGSLLSENASAITTNLGNNSAFLSAVEPSPVSSTATPPQAYLTVLFFDERFNPVPASDGGELQIPVASTWTTSTPALGVNNLKVPKNGYAYIYVSNLSDQPVYFDNFAVAVTAGNIAEEDHYYPMGLKIASISSRRLQDAYQGTVQNYYLYNNKEFFEDGALNWYDYGYRNYDPQIGRFVEMDPWTENYPTLSPFQYAGGDPIGNIDQDGLDIFSVADDGGEVASAAGDVAEGANSVFDAGKDVGLMEEAVVTAVRPGVVAVNSGKYVMTFTSIVLRSAMSGVSLLTTRPGTLSEGDPDQIYAKGLADAWLNAILGGVPDLYNGIMGYNPLDDYDNDADRATYLNGRSAGNGLAIAQSTSEIIGGGGEATAGLATGPGAIFVSTPGALVAGHGALMGGAATADEVWTLSQAIKYGLVLKAAAPTPPKSKFSNRTSGENSYAGTGRRAHQAYKPPGKGIFVDRANTGLDDGEMYPDAISVEEGVIRELKPNNPAAIAKGKAQVAKYAKQAAKEFGKQFKTVVDTYDVNADGTFKFNYGTPK